MAAGDAADGRDPTTIVLFDVDGTLTAPRKRVTPEMLEFLKELRKRVFIGFVGGSDLKKQIEQLGDNVLELFDYSFAQNGLDAYKGTEKIGETDLGDKIPIDTMNRFISFVLTKIAALDIPVKTGTFIERRKGMLNISPVGRNCTQAQRDAFEEYDREHKVREGLIADLKAEFDGELDLQYSIGGQISFDVFPTGWSKVFALQYMEAAGFKTIHFFGDKTWEGGNDFEIYADSRTEGHAVTKPDDTVRICRELFFKDE